MLVLITPTIVVDVEACPLYVVEEFVTGLGLLPAAAELMVKSPGLPLTESDSAA